MALSSKALSTDLTLYCFSFSWPRLVAGGTSATVMCLVRGYCCGRPGGTVDALWCHTERCLSLSPRLPTSSDMKDTVRVTVHRTANWHVDVKVRPRARFAEIRAWRGKRWPDLQKTWRARMRWWIPWFSLRRQAARAVEYVSHYDEAYLTRDDLQRKVADALRWLREELRG